MRALVVLVSCLAACLARAEPAPLALLPPPEAAWQGERVPLVIELRARGAFAGAAQFDLPQVPGALIVRLGNPVVSSQELDGETWFVQRHEFALFAQRAGDIEVPAFALRFAAREGFTGEVAERALEVPGWRVTIRRPPGTGARVQFVTSENYSVGESWEGNAEPIVAGAVLVRHITQRAAGTSAMALVPAANDAPAGVRVYRGRADVIDRTERGVFVGERSETLSYLVEKPGTRTLPALEFAWWNPAAQELRVETLPALTIEVAAAQSAFSMHAAPWAWLVVTALMVAASVLARRRLPIAARRLRGMREVRALRALWQLLGACRRNDAPGAYAAWWQWRAAGWFLRLETAGVRALIDELQRHLYARASDSPWSGSALAKALRQALIARGAPRDATTRVDLPALNFGQRCGP